MEESRKIGIDNNKQHASSSGTGESNHEVPLRSSDLTPSNPEFPHNDPSSTWELGIVNVMDLTRVIGTESSF